MAASETSLTFPFTPLKFARGPLAKSRRRRSLIVYVLLCIIGSIPSFTGLFPQLRVAGMGLWFPGAGFLALGPWGAFATLFSLILFVVSLIAWFGAGMVVAPAIIWLGSATIAALVAPAVPWAPAMWFVIGLTFVTFVYGGIRTRRRYAVDAETLARRNEYLPSALQHGRDTRAGFPDRSKRELTLEQLQSQRYVLDRALQPAGDYNGFDRIDQFQTAALRYQLNQLGYALSMAQCHYTPSFHGYLSQAQRNLIERNTRREIWGYWIYESMWGHLNFTNFDPVGKDNIMLTGFLGIQVGLYMSNSGDRRYLEPGSLTFVQNNRKSFRHSFKDIGLSLIRNFRQSPFCLYPCEPNWIYPICNHYGMTALTLYDRICGTSHVGELLPNWLEKLDSELTDRKGSVVGLRSSLTGWTPPVPSFDGLYVPFANTFVPDRAERLWAFAQTEMGSLIGVDENGRSILQLPGEGADFGNYRKGHGLTFAQIIFAAREMGDYGFAEAATNAMNQRCGVGTVEGVRRFVKASNSANAHAALAGIHQRGDFRVAVREGPVASTLTGPLLVEARYPHVLVARAFSDGENLELVLYPGGSSHLEQLGIERLRPNTQYRCSSGNPSAFVSDAFGKATIDVPLNGRTQVLIERG